MTSANYVNIVDDDNTENIDHTEVTTDGLLPPPTIGARIWAMYQGARRPGKVLSVNDKRGIFKMRFDEFPTAEFDYSFSYKSPAWSYIGAPPPSVESNDALPNIAKKFKALIKVICVKSFDDENIYVFSLCYHRIGN